MNLTEDHKKIIKAQHDKLIQNDALGNREHQEFQKDERNPYQRDYSRILYSSAFRRLQGNPKVL